MSERHFSRLALTLAAWLVILGTVAPAVAQKRLTRAQRDEAERLSAMTDAIADGELAGGDAWLKWSHHRLRGEDGNVYVPFSVVIDEAPGAFQSLSLYVRVANHGEDSSAGRERMRRTSYVGFQAGEVLVNVPERSFVPQGTPTAAEHSAMLRLAHPEGLYEATYPFEDVHFVGFTRTDTVEPFVVRRALSLPPGDYDVYVAVREATPEGEGIPEAKSAILKHRLTLPPFGTTGPQLSSIIVADTVETLPAPLSPDEQLLRPYALGATEIVPARDTIFSPSENLSLVFFVYNLLTDDDGKPNVTIRYRFFQQSVSSSTFFRATTPQEFNPETLPEVFDLEAYGGQLPASAAVPMASFAEGPYRLEIRVTDNLAEQTLIDSLSFVVMEDLGTEP